MKKEYETRLQKRHKVWDQYPDKMNVFSAILDVHMIANGSYKTGAREEVMLNNFLSCVLDTWVEPTDTFDNLVRKLIKEAQSELRTHLES